ncbi:MAG: Nif3-like dinuclear metal center hexameric protein [Spirochaetales bacterium]|nr:Nif3-like dinuclear metal center hexameric protein [Spirochaetales bacterium]
MKLSELDAYFRSIMKIDELDGKDISLNGIQVSAIEGRSEEIEINKIAFAVDACLETFERAADSGANMLFVHHGIFWGKLERISGSYFRRLKYLIDNNLVLYASHIPLDMHPEFGNNAGICSALGVISPEPFGAFRGVNIGFKGSLPEESNINTILDKLGLDERQTMSILPFGSEKIKTVAVISGGGAMDVIDAIDEGVDLYITGDPAHEVYHTCLENKINMISAGHYNTETWGVRLLSEKVASELGLETVFIDVPTGL